MNPSITPKRSVDVSPPLSASQKPSDERPEPWTNRRATEQATRAANARQASGRKRGVDPTTCEREYSFEELEFMQAMQEYKQKSGRMFPTWSEVLEVLRDLGYQKAVDDDAFADAGFDSASV